MWSFTKNQTAKKVNGELHENELNMQDKISLYSRSKQIFDEKLFLNIYDDEREIEI